MSQAPRTGDGPPRTRVPRVGAVLRTTWLTPHMVRVVLGGPGLTGFPDGGFTDRYVKILFPPAGASYDAPYDVEQVRAEHPPEHWPVTRTYTVRAWDPASGELTIDFVHHGDEGVAGPWAAAARPGDRVQFLGPGGGYAPRPDADWHLLAADEAALPAVAATLDRLPEGARALVFLEVADAGDEHTDLAAGPGVDLRWLHRGDAVPGRALVDAVRAVTLPAGNGQVFVHGEAHAVRELRRHLRAQRRLDPGWTSISGYWRCGDTEDRWQSTKREWNAAIESEESAAR